MSATVLVKALSWVLFLHLTEVVTVPASAVIAAAEQAEEVQVLEVTVRWYRRQ